MSASITVYRVESGFDQHYKTTIFDVIAHECDELGNTLLINGELLDKVGHMPARKCVWVCLRMEHAAQYVKAFGEEVEAWSLEQFSLIASDRRGGSLVYLGRLS